MNYSHLNGSPYHVGTCPDCGAQTGDNFNYPCPDCELVQCPSCEEYFKRGVLEPSGLCTDCDKIATELEEVYPVTAERRTKFAVSVFDCKHEIIELVTK